MTLMAFSISGEKHWHHTSARLRPTTTVTRISSPISPALPRTSDIHYSHRHTHT